MYSVGGLVALTTGYYMAKGSLGVLFRIMEARLGMYRKVTFILVNLLSAQLQPKWDRWADSKLRSCLKA